MNCKQARELTIPAVLGDIASSEPQTHEYFAHLRSCAACAEYHESCSQAVAFVQEHKAAFAGSLDLLDRQTQRQKLIAQSWKSIAAKLENLESTQNKAGRPAFFRLLWRSAVAAACLAVGLSLWLALSHPTMPSKTTTSPTASLEASLIRIELLSEGAGRFVHPGEKIATAPGEFKTLLINAKHRVIMNSQTAISLQPLIQNARIGCAVKLAAGQIFAKVRHDGNPFEVATAHGKVVITGTKFDLTATDTVTTLVVAEGSVRLESEKGAVDVGPGQISKLAIQSAPTQPQSCDPARLTAWATGAETYATLDDTGTYNVSNDLADLWLSAVLGPIDLAAIDPDQWIEAKRDWFAKEFPWIIDLQTALATEAVQVDYAELLLRSGDIRRIAFSPLLPDRVSYPDVASLLKAASAYGHGQEWLLQNLPSAMPSTQRENPSKDVYLGLQAIQQWANRLKAERDSSQAIDSRVLLYSLHLTVYLSNTRILTWLTVNQGQNDLSKAEQATVLDLLRDQVETTGNLSQRIISLLCTYTNHLCFERCRLIDSIIEDIEEIARLEGRIRDCEKHQ